MIRRLAVLVTLGLMLGSVTARGAGASGQTGVAGVSDGDSEKYDLWLEPSGFRGFSINYYNDNDGNKTLQDFQDLKDTGASFAQIQTNEGTRRWAPPYGPNREGIQSLDEMVKFCDQVGLNYVIAVREGPGRQAVDIEARDTIWENPSEQQLYAEMLRDDIVAKYQDDPFFVGINVMVEPNPFNEEVANGAIDGPEELAEAMAERGIDINAMMALFISEIRSVDEHLPVIVQSVGWSGPEWWGLLTKQDDPYVIYDFHTYSPRDFTHPDCGEPNCGGLVYPGVYDGEGWNRAYLKNTLLAEVTRFQRRHDVPVMMGEFGMEFDQTGGVQFLSDLVDIAKERGWHFSLWNFRSDTLDPTVLSFDYERWDSVYWGEILSWF